MASVLSAQGILIGGFSQRNVSRLENGLTDRFALKVPEAAKMLAVSKSFLYEIINKRQVGIVRFGRFTRIPAKEIDRI